MDSQGRFLTVEGIEGVGKSTQVAHLSATFANQGIPHVVTREPGGTPLAEQIRGLVLRRGEESVPPAAELLMMFAARAVHLANLIEPALQAGKWVICDRFTDATYAYQGAGRRMSPADIAALESLVQGGRRPHLTLLLDVPVAVGLERSRRRDVGRSLDRFDRERADFFERARQEYLARARAEPARIKVIDAGAPEPEVAAHIEELLRDMAWIS